MRKAAVFILAAAAAMGLTAMAFADMIIGPSPAGTALGVGGVLLLLILISVLIEGVLYLLRKFRKK